MQGKLQIIGAILKLDRPFRPPHLFNVTDLPKELVYYHLKTMTEKGLLRKTGKVYEIENKEILIDSMTEINEYTGTRRMEPARLISKEDIEGFNTIAEGIICSRVLGDKEYSPVVKEMFIAEIDKAIKEFKTLRKFVNAASRSETSAAKFLSKKGMMDKIWELWKIVGYMAPSGISPWENMLEERIEEVLAND